MRKPSPTTCPLCGREIKGHGLGPHAAAHRRKGELGPDEPLAGVALATATYSPAPELSGVDIALAVLAKVSPDGRVAIADLPEVLGWMQSTHEIVKRVGGS
jgi:hypothetical protein